MKLDVICSKRVISGKLLDKQVSVHVFTGPCPCIGVKTAIVKKCRHQFPVEGILLANGGGGNLTVGVLVSGGGAGMSKWG